MRYIAAATQGGIIYHVSIHATLAEAEQELKNYYGTTFNPETDDARIFTADDGTEVYSLDEEAS